MLQKKVWILTTLAIAVMLCIVPVLAVMEEAENPYTVPASEQQVGETFSPDLNCALIAKYIMAKTNLARISHGIAPLTRTAYLKSDALEHSSDMRATGSLHHDLHAGVSGQNVLYIYAGRTLGYPCGGGAHYIPNTANGVAKKVVHLWMKHNACAPRYNQDHDNILDVTYTQTGVGVVYCPTLRRYWVTQNFA
jgi:uncharacterized protein YkwD